MRSQACFSMTAFLLLAAIVARVGAQATPAAPPQGRGRQAGRGATPPTFPEQMRPPGDPALIARGKSLYKVNCARCHGADLRGGDLGGPNLLRSQIVMNDQEGEHIQPIVQTGRPNTSVPNMPPMPAMTFAPEDVRAIAAYLHSVTRLLSRTGVPAPGADFGVLNRLAGDAAAGQAYFAATCSSCHSVTGDLKGIGSRIPDPVELQNTWVAGGAAGRGGGRGGAASAITVTVTPASGPKVEGRLIHVDDFVVTLVDAAGSSQSFVRQGNTPRVEIHDPKAPHKKLLGTYTDKNIHDVTAYLVTLK